MRALALALTLVPLSTFAIAQPRPSTQDMTCSQAQALVLSRGAIVMNTGLRTYDRFVSTAGSCIPAGVDTPAWVSTRDNPQCVLSVCGPRTRSGG